ncbi:MAG: translation initiation factor IF-1 [Cyanobacteria bacterium J06638_28]
MGSYLVSTEGVVIELLPNILFRVQLSDGSEILGTPSRQMKKNYIPIEMGDHVEVAMTSQTATQGCIVGCLSRNTAVNSH